MSRKLRQVLAIIALGFMAIFTVVFVVWLVNPSFFGGKLGLVCLVSGGLGVGLFLVLKLWKPYITQENETSENNAPKNDGDKTVDNVGAKEIDGADTQDSIIKDPESKGK